VRARRRDHHPGKPASTDGQTERRERPRDGEGGGRSAHRGGRGARSSGADQGGGDRAGSGGPGRSRRKNRKRRPKVDADSFWGDAARLPVTEADVRITDDPGAVPRSLGTPPLPGQETIAPHYFAAVYDRAVTTAGALAAAGGLIDTETLAEELGD
jgi:hypothetical protein